MFLQVFKFELKKIIHSNKFKFAVIDMIFISLFLSVQQKLEFTKYDNINIKNKLDYKKNIVKLENFLKDPYESSNAFYKKHPEAIESDIITSRKDLNFYKSHQLPELKKNLIQGFIKNFDAFQIYIILIGIFCSDIISDEKAKNTLSFQFTCKTKRSTLYNAKYLALISSIGILIISNIVFSLITNGIILGFSDINGTIQQVRSFEMATVNMSILSLVTGKILFLFLCCASFACIFILVSSLFNNFLVPFILCILIVSFSNVFLYEFQWTYFLLSTYESVKLIFYFGDSSSYNLAFSIISMLVQSAILYMLGFFVYNRMQVK